VMGTMVGVEVKVTVESGNVGGRGVDVGGWAGLSEQLERTIHRTAIKVKKVPGEYRLFFISFSGRKDDRFLQS
jgi:hypothetical protein